MDHLKHARKMVTESQAITRLNDSDVQRKQADALKSIAHTAIAAEERARERATEVNDIYTRINHLWGKAHNIDALNEDTEKVRDACAFLNSEIKFLRKDRDELWIDLKKTQKVARRTRIGMVAAGIPLVAINIAAIVIVLI